MVTGKATLDDCLAEINAMTGLTSVKQSLSTIAIKARFDVMRLRGGSGRADRGSVEGREAKLRPLEGLQWITGKYSSAGKTRWIGDTA